MKTNQNNQITPSEIPPQSGQVISDNNPLKKYEVEVYLTEYKYATVILEAASEDEAGDKALELTDEELGGWKLADRDQYVASVEPVSEGKSHD